MIEPVQAIRYGMSEIDYARMTQRMNSPLANAASFGKLPVSFVIGVRSLIKNSKSSVLMVLLTSAAASVLVFGYLVLTSITGIDQTAAKWGYDNANIAGVVVDKTMFSEQHCRAHWKKIHASKMLAGRETLPELSPQTLLRA
jgi:putative ABC transport system permease protein